MLDKHNLKLTLQNHFRDGLVIVVGCGLSCAEGIPGMGMLADHLAATVHLHIDGADRDLWRDILMSIKDVGLETALIRTPPTPTLESAIVAATVSILSAAEKRVLSEVFTGRRVLRLSRLLKHVLKPSGGLPIITTNYDRLVEVAAEEADLGVDCMFIGGFAGRLDENESSYSFVRKARLVGRQQIVLEMRDRVNVFKPHGSLDWYFRRDRPVRFSGDLDSQRLIITPGLNKFRNGYETPFDRHREKANRSIDAAKRILIIGYGFNDDHLETHLLPRIRAGVPTLLITHSLSAKARDLVQEVQSVSALCAPVDGSVGTVSYVESAETLLTGVEWWDLAHFVPEVLE